MSGLIGKLSALVTATVDKTNELLQARFENTTKPDQKSTQLSERKSEWTDLGPGAIHTEVLTRIAAEKEKNTGHLDLSKLGLTDVPQEVLELTDLKSLDLSGNALTILPTDVIDTLDLETLNISGNEIIPTMITGNRGITHYLPALFQKIESDNYLAQ